MKQTRLALALVACLLSGFVCMAQNTIVEGSNLNIGENNTLSSDITGTKGHAIGRYNIVESHNALAVGSNDTIGDPFFRICNSEASNIRQWFFNAEHTKSNKKNYLCRQND